MKLKLTYQLLLIMISIINFFQINYEKNSLFFDLRLFLIIILNMVFIVIQFKSNKSIAIFNLISSPQLILAELYINLIAIATYPDIILIRFYIIFVCFIITNLP